MLILYVISPPPFTVQDDEIAPTLKLTFPAVFITDLISLLQALEDFIWM